MREFFRPLETASLDALGRAAARIQEERGLPADVYEGEEEYLVLVDAPGSDPADVQTRYVEGRIEIRVDRFRAFHEGFELRYPGRGQSLSGRVDLPDDADVNPERASATLDDDGTLRIRLPKHAE